MCHVFRCDSAPAKEIANTLKDTCRRLIAEKAKASAGSAGTSTTTSGERLVLKRPCFLPDIAVNTSKVDINLKLRSVSFNKDVDESGQIGETVSDSSSSSSVPLTPMQEEPCKRHTCKYLGSVPVSKPYGMETLNTAIEKIYSRALEDYKKMKLEKKLRRRKRLGLFKNAKSNRG